MVMVNYCWRRCRSYIRKVFGAIELDKCSYMCSLLGCGFRALFFFFLFLFLIMLLALVVTNLSVVTSICSALALRNHVEAMSMEIFEHNWSKSECFQVQPVTCCDISRFLDCLTYIS